MHESADANRPFYRSAFRHVLGTSFDLDEERFIAGEDEKLRLHIVPGAEMLGFVVTRFRKGTITDFFLWQVDSDHEPEPILQNARIRNSDQCC